MTHTPSFKMTFARALMLSGAAVLCFSTAAYAGFEWRGPIAPPVKSAPAPMGSDMSGLEPVISWDGKPAADVQWSKDSAPAPAVPAVVTQPVESMPVSPALAPFTAQTPAAQALPQGDVLEGFGRDLPLVIALQQVVPPGHQFSFASGVNPGVNVSWDGGKPWQAVLNDMLATQGLGYRLQGNVLVVGYFASEQGASAPVSPMSEQLPDDMMGTPAAAPAATPGEPVTIRRQRLSKISEQEAVVAEQPVVAQTYTPVVAAPAAAPVALTRNAYDSRTAGSSAVMSYPPSATSSQPVPVNALPPSALQQQSAAPAPSEDLSAPPQDLFAPVTDSSAPAAQAVPVAPVETKVESAPVQEKPVSLAAAPVDTKSAVMPTVWKGNKGKTLRDTLKAWSTQAGVELYWSIDYDYSLKGDVDYKGSYDEAVAGLLDQFAAVRPQPYGQLHQAKGGPRVLVVKSYDLSQ